MLKVNVAGKMTPTESLVPLAVVMAWLMHLPSKKTLAFVWMATPSMVWVGREQGGFLKTESKASKAEVDDGN